MENFKDSDMFTKYENYIYLKPEDDRTYSGILIKNMTIENKFEQEDKIITSINEAIRKSSPRMSVFQEIISSKFIEMEIKYDVILKSKSNKNKHKSYKKYSSTKLYKKHRIEDRIRKLSDDTDYTDEIRDDITDDITADITADITDYDDYSYSRKTSQLYRACSYYDSESDYGDSGMDEFLYRWRNGDI